jgi:hypothetical protein
MGQNCTASSRMRPRIVLDATGCYPRIAPLGRGMRLAHEPQISGFRCALHLAVSAGGHWIANVAQLFGLGAAFSLPPLQVFPWRLEGGSRKAKAPELFGNAEIHFATPARPLRDP